MELNPKDVESWNDKGLVLKKLNRIQGALELDPHSEPAIKALKHLCLGNQKSSIFKAKKDLFNSETVHK